VKQAGSYSVTVGTGGACPATSEPLVFTVAPRPPVSVVPPGPLAFCSGDSVILDGGTHASYAWSKDNVQITGAASKTFVAHQSGNYTVTVQDSATCFATSSPVAVNVYPPPATPTITQNGTQLTASTASGYIWQRNGSTVQGASSQSITPDSDGTYIVIVTDANGCSATSAPFPYSRDTIQAIAAVSVRRITNSAPGSMLSIPLILTNGNRLSDASATSFAGRIRVASSLVTATDPGAALVGGEWFVPVSGALSALPDTLTYLHFTAGMMSPDCGTIYIDTFYFPNAHVNVTRASGDVCIIGACTTFIAPSDTAFFIHSITPNPSIGTFTVQYHIAEEGPANIALEDILGRRVAILKDESMKVGTYRETYDPNGLTSGMYRLVLRSGSRMLYKMIGFTR